MIKIKEILQENDPFLVGFQDYIRIITLVPSDATHLPRLCPIPSLPKNPEKDFKNGFEVSSAVEMTLKTEGRHTHKEHLLFEHTQSPSR